MSTTGIPILDIIRKIQAPQQSGTTPVAPPVITPPANNPASGNKPVTTPVQIPKPSQADLDDLFVTGVD